MDLYLGGITDEDDGRTQNNFLGGIMAYFFFVYLVFWGQSAFLRNFNKFNNFYKIREKNKPPGYVHY